jgi:hypothetical protein
MIGQVGTLRLLDLTAAVQNRMLIEWQREEASGNPYRSPRLTEAGVEAFVAAMPTTLLGGTELTLADALANREYWKRVEHRVSSRGRWIAASMPRNANEVLAWTEYLTWYTRAVAGQLHDEGEDDCVVYRAAPAWQPRCECRSLEGLMVKTIDVYNGHRARYWPIERPGAFSIPVGVNCHHTITRARRPS